MNKKLKRTVLDGRQFVGLLLVVFALAALAISFTQTEPDKTSQGMSAQLESEALMVQEFGFLLPPLQSLLLPCLAVVVFLVIIFCWLSIKWKSTK